MKGPMVENVVLTVHLILALLLIGVVLLQRSEGGGLGMGGGGGGVMTGRQAANALSRLTWIFATGFIITSLTLTVIAARNASSGSIMDQLDIGASAPANPSPSPALDNYAPPPGTAGQPVTPPAPAGATSTPAASTPAAPAQDAAAVTPPAAQAPASPAPAAPATEAPATGTPAPANN